MNVEKILCGSDELRIALDVESVLADTHPYFIEVYNERFDTEYSPCDIDNWDWVREEVEWEDFDRITQEGWMNRADEIQVREENISEAVSQLESLTDSTTVDIVTARTGVEEEMKTWLQQNEITNYTEFIATEEKKTELGYNVYIDDNPNMPERINETQLQVLIRGTHNRTVTEQNNVFIEYTIWDAVKRLQGAIEQC